MPTENVVNYDPKNQGLALEPSTLDETVRRLEKLRLETLSRDRVPFPVLTVTRLVLNLSQRVEEPQVSGGTRG